MGSFFSKTPPLIRYNDYIDIRFQQQTGYRKIGPPGGLKCPLKEEYRTMPGLESTFDTVEACESGKLELLEKEKVKVPVERRQFDPHRVDYATNERNRQLAYEQAEKIAQDRAKTMTNSRYRGGKKSRRSKSQKKHKSSRKSTKKMRKNA